MKFDEIIPAVKRGDVDAGLLIHEGRITYETHGLVKILDLWEWWYDKTSLPLPLGLNAIRRDIPVEQQRAFLKAMRASIDYALRNADEAIECAMKYSSSKKKLAKKFALCTSTITPTRCQKALSGGLKHYIRWPKERGLFKKPPLDILYLFNANSLHNSQQKI